MDGLGDMPVDERTAKFALYREVCLVGSTTLKGENVNGRICFRLQFMR